MPFHHAIVTGLATSRGQQKHPNEVGPNQSAALRSDRRVGQIKMPPDPATQTPGPLQNAEPEPLQLAEINRPDNHHGHRDLALTSSGTCSFTLRPGRRTRPCCLPVLASYVRHRLRVARTASAYSPDHRERYRLLQREYVAEWVDLPRRTQPERDEPEARFSPRSGDQRTRPSDPPYPARRPVDGMQGAAFRLW